MKCKYCGKITKEKKYSDCDYWVSLLKGQNLPVLIVHPMIFDYKWITNRTEEKFIEMLEDSFFSAKKKVVQQYRGNKTKWLKQKGGDVK